MTRDASVRSQRRVVRVGNLDVVLVDSITQVLPEDAGQVVVTGSHGGGSAASFAMRVPALLYVFNDAGIGKDRAGISGLDGLEAQGIAACAVSNVSARIGDASDTLENGVISSANALAGRLGLACASRLRTALQDLHRTDPVPET